MMQERWNFTQTMIVMMVNMMVLVFVDICGTFAARDHFLVERYRLTEFIIVDKYPLYMSCCISHVHDQSNIGYGI